MFSALRSLAASKKLLTPCTYNSISRIARISSKAPVQNVPDSIIIPKPAFERPLVLPHEKKPNMMKVIERESLQRANHDGRADLFVRRAHKSKRMCPGDVVMVESINSMSKPASTSTFVGICIAISRRGIDTAFVLRNTIMKVGVEMRFPAYSPMVKSIKILQKGEGFRRAKLFYLRNLPGKAYDAKSFKKALSPSTGQKKSKK
ncbi:hypothetical protein H4219_002692 [Mycoemilia scoparia]|uniref:Mitochondrial ribosomal protein L19 n=1 Tax=Mycoemilia scoparia TaxID=417184 RepID=A0A9W8A691_9FUNG|nr:hypothetical protein H4219_002692 [Mycoemilia scoparia]